MNRHGEHPEASAELIAAAERLEGIAAGLGHALFAEAREAVEAIEEYPEGWPHLPGWDHHPLARSKSIQRFHFRVIYVIHDGQPVILAYAHERQRPGYWRHRYEDIRDI